MKTDITILCDNYVGRPGLIGEHGFCALIERDSKSFLFDSGSGVGLEHNAKFLQKSIKGLSRIDLQQRLQEASFPSHKGPYQRGIGWHNKCAKEQYDREKSHRAFDR